MITFVCRGCGKSLHARDDLAGRKTKCSACGAALVVPAQEAPEPVLDVVPAEPEGKAAPSLLNRIVRGSLKGIGLPFLLALVLLVDIGVNALLGIKNPSPRSSLLETFFPGNQGLKLLLVGLAAFLGLALGALAGNAAAGTVGALVGAGLGYLLGSTSAGAFAEVLTGRNEK